MHFSLRGRLWPSLLLLLIPTLLSAGTADLTLKLRGKQVAKLSLAQIEKLVPARDIKVLEPHLSEERVYHGFPVDALFEKVYGAEWKKAEEVLFTCTDGYQPSIPLGRFRKFDAYLVYRRPGEEKFEVINRFQGNEKVTLAPFYLVWDNLKKPELKAQGAEGWPYQIVTVDLIQFADKFPRLAPPATASDAAKRGFLAFRAECLACHTINGEGGAKAIELNYPVSVTEYFDTHYLRQWISDPASIRYGTRMPGINRANPRWKENLDDILAYLKTMAKNKQKPQSKR